MTDTSFHQQTEGKTDRPWDGGGSEGEREERVKGEGGGETDRERVERHTYTEGQTDRQAGRQSDRRTERERERVRQTDREGERDGGSRDG